MRFYKNQHQFYAGIDLHARQMFICIIDSDGNILFHINMSADPTHLLRAIRPYKDDIIIGVECVFTWYWIADFCDCYDDKYATIYGMYRLERIQQIGERFSACGDYLKGAARIRCTKPECGHDYFRPFSCKGFFLCPSCSRKRALLFAEHLTDEVLLKLPHR